MRILFYCQHVLGIGHFFRSMEIAGALWRHEVLFAGGGELPSGFELPRHVRMLRMPSLMMDAEFKAMEFSGGSLEAVREERGRMLLDAFTSYDPEIFVTELFPFGRRQFRFELMPVLKIAKERPRRVKIVCSLRDILVEKNKPDYESGVIEILNGYYDLLLVHSDPIIASLSETFSGCAQIQVPIEYTGFVARSAPERKNPESDKIIVASSGGGRVGTDLLAAAILAVRQIERKDLKLRVFVGPFMEKSERARLDRMAVEDSRISLLPFSLDFPSELCRADLSISMAGYNTCMDILSSGVPAIVHPFPRNREQGMRAGKLEKLGLMEVLEHPEAGVLKDLIESILKRTSIRPSVTINLAGAVNSARLIENILLD